MVYPERQSFLFELAHERKLPSLQRMDIPTLDWIERESVATVKEFPDTCTVITDDDCTLLEALLPDDDWFLNTETTFGIHGRRHLFRVMINSIWLCNLTGMPSRPIVLAASLHDIRRLNDQADPGHGERASEFFIKLKQKWDLSTIEEDQIAAAITYHEVKPTAIPPEVIAKHDKAISLIKAADALDRYRQPYAKWWPNPNLFIMKEALQLLRACRMLTLLSERAALTGEADWPAVIKSALSISKSRPADAS